MRQSKLQYLTIQQFTFFAYFTATTIMFFLALAQGNEGVTFKLFGGGDDGYFYWIQAKNVAMGNSWVETSMYPFIIGKLIQITGIESAYLIRIFNYLGFLLLVLFSLMLISIQFKFESNIVDYMNIYNSRSLLLVFFLFYTSLQMNVNFSILRDIWIYTLYVLSTILSIKVLFSNNNRIIYLSALTIALLLLGEFRDYALLSFVLTLSIYFIFKKIKMLKNPRILILILIIGFAFYYTFLMDFTIFNMSLRRALTYRATNLEIYTGGSQMWIKLDQPNILFFLMNYMHSYVGNLIGPLPWHISGFNTLFIFFVETIPMVLILNFLWKKRNLLSKIQNYILLHGFMWVGLIGVTNDNIGTASRLRPIAWILILIVFVVIYSKKRCSSEKIKNKVVVK